MTDATARATASISGLRSMPTTYPALLGHVPVKWTPVRRQEHAQLNESRACSEFRTRRLKPFAVSVKVHEQFSHLCSLAEPEFPSRENH